MRRVLLLLCAVALLTPAFALASGFGMLDVNKKNTPLTHSCAITPRFDMQGWGKPEVTLLFSDKDLDCAAIAGWASPDSGAFDQAVERGDGALVSVSFQPGLKLGKIAVYGVGYTLAGDSCEGCKAEAAYAGAGLKGSVKTTKPLRLSDSAIAFEVRFDLPKPAGPGGEKLGPGGGEPGKAYVACLAAYKAGDYAALQKLLPENEAESSWGYYESADERKKAIQEDDKAKRTAKVLEGWKQGNGAIVVFETQHPWNKGEKIKGVASLGFDGTSWRFREERLDYGGSMFTP